MYVGKNLKMKHSYSYKYNNEYSSYVLIQMYLKLSHGG